MKILILGGFLGSGKTSVLLQLAEYLVSLKKEYHSEIKVAIVENEIGAIGIDDKVLKKAGFIVNNLFSGCACCSLTGELVADKGIPKTAKDRLDVFTDLMAKCQEYKIDPSRMHIDPLIEMLCTSEDGIAMVTEVIREIKKQYPTIHVTGAVSNISFNLPARRIANQAFAVLAMSAGMDSFILDPLNKDMMGMLFATEAMMGEDEYCMEYIGAFREGIFVK